MNGVSRSMTKSIDTSALAGLLANEILSALPGEDFLRLLPHLNPVTLAAGEDLYRFESDARFVYFSESAVISQLHVLANGHTIEAAMIGREGLVGLYAIFSVRQPNHWTRVLVGGSALRIESETLRQEFKRGAAMQRLLLAYMSARMAQLSQRAVCNGCHTIEQRLCHWLLMVSDRTVEERLQLTHEQIATHLGARRASVTEIANNLREKGVISYSRGLVSILNRQALIYAACECYALHRSTRRKGAEYNIA